MFFNLSRSKLVIPKIAKHIKIPYATNIANIFNSTIITHEVAYFYPYRETHNTIYCVKVFGDRTYFKTTNNLLTYENKKEYEVPVLIPDIHNTSYKLIRFDKLDIINESEDNFLVVTGKDKTYFVSTKIKWHDNKIYVAVLNVKSGKPLFMLSISDAMLIQLLHIVDKSVIPIFKVDKQNVSVYLVDLSSDKVGVISWSLMNIKQLIISLLDLGKVPASQKSEVLKDEIKYLHVKGGVYKVDVIYDVRQEDNKNVGKDLYIKGVEVRFDLVVYGENLYHTLDRMSIKIEADNGKIVCYWDVTDVILTSYKKAQHSRETMYDFYLRVLDKMSNREPKMLKRSYILGSKMAYKYISTDLYENKCYLVQQNKYGIIVKEKSLTKYEQYYRSSLYRYGKYLIIIQDHLHSKMVFIDTERNLIYKFVIYTDQYSCVRSRYTYHYYPLYKLETLILLSKDLQCLVVVDMKKVEYFINMQHVENCKALDTKNIVEKYPSIEEVCIVLDVREMIVKAIYDRYKFELNPNDVVILGHQLSESAMILHIVARYVMWGVEHIGVFVFNTSNKKSRFELSYAAIRSLQNPAISLFSGKSKYFRFISNINLHKLNFGRVSVSNIDIYYSEHGALVSAKYNRVSCPVMTGYYDKSRVLVESLGNFIIMKYDCVYVYDIDERERGYGESECSSSYVLLLYDLVLVQKMPAVFM